MKGGRRIMAHTGERRHSKPRQSRRHTDRLWEDNGRIAFDEFRFALIVVCLARVDASAETASFVNQTGDHARSATNWRWNHDHSASGRRDAAGGASGNRNAKTVLPTTVASIDRARNAEVVSLNTSRLAAHRAITWRGTRQGCRNQQSIGEFLCC